MKRTLLILTLCLLVLASCQNSQMSDVINSKLEQEATALRLLVIENSIEMKSGGIAKTVASFYNNKYKELTEFRMAGSSGSSQVSCSYQDGSEQVFTIESEEVEIGEKMAGTIMYEFGDFNGAQAGLYACPIAVYSEEGMEQAGTIILEVAE